MAQPFLSIVIPARDEAERLPLTLVDLDKYLSRKDYSYEILVVNDGSEDKTYKIVEGFSKMMKNLKLIHNEEKKGKGAAVRQGMLLARGKYRAFLDADNSLHLTNIEDALPHLKLEADVVIGSRVGKSRIWPVLPPHRQLVERFTSLICGPLLFGGIRERIRDIHSGFSIFTDEVAENIFPHIKSNGWGFGVEAIALARYFGYRIKELPVLWRHDRGREMPYSAYLQVLADAVKARWRLSRGIYANVVPNNKPDAENN